MSSSDGGSGNFAQMIGNATPMPGLPIAGQGGGVGDPFKYGKFQNFLPDIKTEGPNDNATGLRPDMFRYRGPDGSSDDGSSGGSGGTNVSNDQISGLRDQLAQLTAKLGQGGGAIGWPGGQPQFRAADPIDTWTNRS